MNYTQTITEGYRGNTDNLYEHEPRDLVAVMLVMHKALQLVRPEGDYDDEDEWMQASAACQRALRSFDQLVRGPNTTNSAD